MIKSILRMVFVICFFFGFTGFAHTAEKDAKGSQDHPLFTRMPGYYILSYKVEEFAREKFRVGKSNVEVEGKKFRIVYSRSKGQQDPGQLAIIRNHVNAIKSVGGEALDEKNHSAILKLVKDGNEYLTSLRTFSGQYTLEIIEKVAMSQVVSSEAILKALEKDGFVTIDVHFDTAKALIKPESGPLLDQVATMLKQSPKLSVSVEGHTDNVGEAKSNKTLSEARARSVVDALIKRGIDSKRLTAAGFGAERPVADNRTEEGRAKNRRVELVKK